MLSKFLIQKLMNMLNMNISVGVAAEKWRKLKRGSEGPEVNVVQTYRPESLEELCNDTRFNKKELQHMYRTFKQSCPDGKITQQQLADIYAAFFPNKKVDLYTGYVFNCFDVKNNGFITFRDLVVGLSTLCRGTTEERLGWVFNLYDVNKDGVITRNDIILIMRSMYEIMGHTVPPINDKTIQDHVDFVFMKLDGRCRGEIRLTDFLHCCSTDPIIIESITLFDNII